MKALKEKRISLRSLWRRGLVILSLFALVFASCVDSGSGEATTTEEGKVVKSRVLSGAPTKLYLGAPIDLSGVKMTISYTDESTPTVIEYDKSPGYFYTIPAAATGEYDTADGKFTGMPSYTIVCDGTRSLQTSGFTVYDIMRDEKNWVPDTVLTLNSEDDITDRGVYSTGLGVTGKLGTTKEYVDVEEFNFSGLNIRATYTDGTTKVINPENIEWMILPDYSKPTAAKDGYQGWVYMMVGADREKVITTPAAGKYRYGVTHREPLETVYTVKAIDGVPGDELADFFFWQPNTPEAWTQRLVDAKYALKITYSNGETKTKPIDKIKDSKKIWWNYNPGGDVGDFFVLPLKYPFAKPNTKPVITLYYRGASGNGIWGGAKVDPLEIPIDVFTKLSSLTVLSASGEELSYTGDDELPKAHDNDVLFGGEPAGTEAGFTKLLDVKAVYQAYNDATKFSKPLTLTWAGAAASVGGDGQFVPGKAYGAFYITSYELIDKTTLKDGKMKAVKVYHQVVPADAANVLNGLPTADPKGVEQKKSYEFGAAGFGDPLDTADPTSFGISTKKMSGSINVTWAKRD